MLLHSILKQCLNSHCTSPVSVLELLSRGCLFLWKIIGFGAVHCYKLPWHLWDLDSEKQSRLMLEVCLHCIWQKQKTNIIRMILRDIGSPNNRPTVSKRIMLKKYFLDHKNLLLKIMQFFLCTRMKILFDCKYINAKMIFTF